MIGGMLGRINTAERMTVEQLQAAMEQGSLPAYIGVPILQEKVQMRDRALSIPMGQELAQQPPIMEEILQSARNAPGAAPMVEGIDQLPTQLNPAAGMASGGIVAFQKGGDVDEEVSWLEAWKRRLLPEPSGGRRPYSVREKDAKGGDYTQDPEYQANEHLTHDYKDAYKRETLDGYTNWEPPVPAEAIEKNQGKNRFREVDTNKPIPEEFIKDFPEEGGDTDTPKPRPDDIGAVGTGTQTHGGQGIAALPARTAESAVGEMPVPKRDPMQEYIDMLMQERQDAADSKTQDKYMALLQAGLATMAGNSPNALQNIGAGAQAGIGYYKDTRAAADKQSRDALRDVMGLEARRHERAEDLGFKEREMAQKDRQLDIMSARANAVGSGAGAAGVSKKDITKTAVDIAKTRISGMVVPPSEDEVQAIYAQALHQSMVLYGLVPTNINTKNNEIQLPEGALDALNKLAASKG